MSIPALLTSRSNACVEPLEGRTLLSANLLINGSFTRGNAGFATGLRYDRTSIETEGTFVVGNDPTRFHPVGESFGDHTTGSGNMLIVNGAIRPKVTVWRETVSVVPGVAYSFTCWGTSWGGVDLDDISPAIPEVSVNGSVIGAITLPAADGDWTPLTGTWLARTNSATITLIDVNTQAAGNDSAYDDFSVTPLASIRGAVVSQKQVGPKKLHIAPLANVTVYLDINNDGVLDAGDLTTITSKTGAFAFTGLSAGIYQVRQTPMATEQAVMASLPVKVASGTQAGRQNLLDTPLVWSAVADNVR